MSTNFPTSLDALTNPSSTDSMATVSHSGQHANANDAIEALQAKVGVDSSAVTTSLDYRVAQLELGGGGGGASVTVSDTAPSSPTEGDLWFESDTGDIFVYYDSAWIDVGGSSVANISVSATAPTTGIVNGDLWFDTDTAKTYVYYDDGTSTQWVEVGAASAAASGVDGAIQFASGGTFSSDANNLYWDDTNNRLGINTSSPTAQLDVYGGANVSTTMTVGGNLTVDTSTLHVDSTNDRVGIGTTSPTYDLHVEGTGGFGAGTAAAAITTADTGNTAATLEFQADASAFDVTLFASGATPANAAYLTQRNNAPIVMMTNNAERIRIEGGGNVGIGVASPAENLDVKGSSSDVSMLLRSGDNSGGSNAGKQIVFGYGGGANYAHNIRTRHNGGGQNGNAFDFYTWNQGTDAVSTYGTKLVLSVGADGVLMPQQPYFHANGFDWSTVPTSVTTVKPPTVTQRNMGAYGYSASTGYFYPPVNGLYLFGYEAGCYSSGTNAAYWRASLRYNGSGIHDTLSNINYILTGTHDFINLTHIIYLTVGNYVSVTLDTTYSNLNSYGYQHFYGVLIA